MVESNETVWQRVCELRENSGLSVSDVAARSGVPLTTVKRFFRGDTKNPGFLQVCQIIRALDADVDAVLETEAGQAPPGSPPADERYCQQLQRDLNYERRAKHRWQIAFVALCVLVMLVMLVDIFNPNLGYIRYQAIQSMPAPGDVAARILRGLCRL